MHVQSKPVLFALFAYLRRRFLRKSTGDSRSIFLQKNSILHVHRALNALVCIVYLLNDRKILIDDRNKLIDEADK